MVSGEYQTNPREASGLDPEAVHDAASPENELWAQVVKNSYDALEQAASAFIAANGNAVPRRHPEKIKTFIELADMDPSLERAMLEWLRRRSDSQYVDIRGDQVNIPHEQFDRSDADDILDDTKTVIRFVTERTDIDSRS